MKKKKLKRKKTEFTCTRCGKLCLSPCDCDKGNENDDYSSSSGYGDWGHDE